MGIHTNHKPPVEVAVAAAAVAATVAEAAAVAASGQVRSGWAGHNIVGSGKAAKNI